MIRNQVLCACAIVILLSAVGVDAGNGAKLGPLDIPGSVAKGQVTKRAPLYPSLDAGLNRILTESDQLETAKNLGYRVRDGRIQIVAVTNEGSAAELISWLASSDAVHISSAGNLVQAFVPVDVLYEIESHYLVKFVRKPNYVPRPPEPGPFPKSKVLSYTSEGVAAMNADTWHGSGATGQGVKVGVIDLGFQGVNSLLGTDLPGSTRVTGMSFGGTDFEGALHGSACAEIVYDVAPGLSNLYLAAITSGVDMVNAIAWLEGEGVDIISMSLGYGLLGGPGNGTGPLADVIDAYVAGGGIIAISAGNEAYSHWQGSWSDNDSDSWLNFTSSAEINAITNYARTEWLWIPAETELAASLTWNQWNRPTTDLDFCLYTWTDETDPVIVACSEDEQSGQEEQYPVESLSFTVVEEGYYGVGVKLYSGDSNVDIELEIADAPVQYLVESGSISVPADTASALSVGAVDAGSPYSIEIYSSRGPTNGPGGSLTGGFIKPDIAGYANVSTTSYGSRSGGYPFNGTSSACPHVAGAAALVWSANPSWTNAQVRSFLQTKAVDKGPSGRDNTYGYGRLYLGSPPTSCTYSLSPTSKDFGPNGGSGTFSVSAPSGCSWDATSPKSWIHITGGSSGSGNGTVYFDVDVYISTSQRGGTIQVADKTFSILQAGATSCSYSISPSSRSHGASGGSGTFTVSTSASCSWSASSSRSWITVTGGSSGSGNGTVSYSVASNSSSSARSGSIAIGGKSFTVSQSGSGGSAPSGDYTYYAVVAHTTGSNNSVWQSSLSACNVSPDQTSVALTYHYGSNKSVTRTTVIQPYALAEWMDAPIDLFNVAGKSSGVVTIESDAPLLVAVRTFNSSVDGTFGQSLPGASSSVSMTSSQYGIISPVRRTSQFRTNIGVINTGNKSCTVTVAFGNANGWIIGDPINIDLAPGEWKQINEAIKQAGISRADAAIALVRLETAGAEVWAYGTVIDNSSGDPTALQVAVFD